MLNQAKEELNKLIQRLEMIFQVQTQEVVQDLKKIRELLETPEDIEEVVEEPKQEVIKEVEVKQPEEDKSIPEVKQEESKEDVTKRYIEKFQKKPFAGRPVEVLKEKMGE